MKQGNISFIYRSDILGKGKSGETVVVPGHPEKSEMYKRIISKDMSKGGIMPPAEGPHSKPLNKTEIALIKKWIEQGAEYEQHWAYYKPSKVEVQTKQKAWVKQGMDKYVLNRLEKHQLKPSPEASKAQWLRRASLDLTGVPATLAELAAFEANTTPNAHEKEVDRLLASEQFGERWASIWMDLARYSDTKGYEKDPHRNIWPYRDWLINAFNQDLPYDIFLRDQLAGDLLPNPTSDQITATALHRNTQTNTEGGTDDEEFRVMATIDRVNTTWTAMQGLTFGCTQCHAHPYEPIPHEDYYSFIDYFNSTEDADLDNDHPLFLVAHDKKQRPLAVQLQRSIGRAQTKSKSTRSDLAWARRVESPALRLPQT